MDTVNRLLESANPYTVLQNQAGKLAGKWGKSGLLEGIDSSTEKNNMAILLENQAKQLVNEANSTGTGASFNSGNSEAWAGVALPLVRRVFGEIVAKDLVSVQPMNLPAGLIFYLDFQYGTNTGVQSLSDSLYAASSDLTKTELPAAGATKGLYGAGTFGYSINSASVQFHQSGGQADAFSVTGNQLMTNDLPTASFGFISVNDSGSVNYNADFMAANTLTDVLEYRIPTAAFTDPDLDSVRSWVIQSTAGTVTNYGEFNSFVKGNSFVTMYVATSSVDNQSGDKKDNTIVYFKGPDNLNDVGDFEEGKNSSTIAGAGSVSNLNIPEINVQLRSDTVAAKTRKLKAQWTPEFAQDLNAYHSIDAEAELTSILSEYISMEIDLEILDMLIQNADTVSHWSAKIGREVAGETEVVVGSAITDNTTGVYYTKMSWFQTLGVKLQKVSNLIHQKTLRGGANFMVVSPKISTILESIPGFAADSPGDKDKYAMGVQKVGAINSRYDVYKNPYITENTILMGYKGSQFLETGAVFAPYIPLIMTPLVYDPVSFTPKKGIMTRYAKKMVRPDFYGKVICHNLDEI
jgi:hypothetical protein